MERQRVVHYAKRRIAKVLEPTCTSRALTSSPRSPLESPHAPLASIDSDFIVITKNRDRTNMAPNVWEQIGKNPPPPPQGDNINIVQAVATESTILDFANSLSDQHINSQPRTYIKLRSTQTLDVQKPGLGNKDKKKYSTLPERHSLHQGPSRTTANNNRSFTTSPLDTNNLGNITRDIVTLHNDTTLCKKAESIERHGVASMGRPISSNMNQTFPRSSRELLKLPSRKFPKPDVSIHEGGPLNSSPSFQASNGVRHEDIQARTIHRDDGTHLDLSTTNNRNIKSGYNCSIPHIQSDLTVVRDMNNSENDIIHNNFSVFVSQYKTDIGNDQSSEMSSFEVDFANKQLNSGIATNCYSKSKDKFNDSVSSNHTGLHTKNNTIFHSDNRYRERGTSTNGNLSDCKKQGEPRSENPHSVNWESKICDSRDVPEQISLSDNSFGVDSKPNWKRESMILATHGHSSVADLDDSFEYLTVKTDNNVSNDRKVCRDAKQGQKSLGSVLNMEDNSTRFADKNEFLPFRNTGSNIANPNQLRKFNDILNIHKLKIDATEENKSQKLSFKLAALGIGDVWIIQRDGCDPLNNSNGPLDNAKTNRKSSSATSQPAKIYDTNKCSQVDMSQDSRASISGNVRTQNFCSDDLNYDQQQLRKLQKHLSKLETSSVSDIAFSDDDIDNTDNLETFSQEHGQVKELSASSITSSCFITPKYHCRRLRDDSLSSDQYSSAGSFHSCQSGDLSPQPSANSNKRQLISTHMHQRLSSRRSNASENSRNSDDSLSGDTSYYYTAADSSFLTEDGASRINQIKRGSHRTPSNSQTSEFAKKCNEMYFHNQTQVGSSSLRKNLQSQRGKSPRSSNPNPAPLCYNSILGDEMSLPMQVRQRKKISRVISDRAWVYPEYARGGLSVNCRRSKSVPSIRRTKTKHSDASARTSSRVQRQTYAEESMPQNDRSSLKSVQRSYVSSSRSILHDSELFNLPRLPPSLGRPRRKMYAGFDSQPLPMDSFLSDSSSVYSTQSCSSWGTSRSATVESRSRSPDISSNIRAISSTASSTITPTAPLSQDNVFDFFVYSDKRSSTFPDNHNVYFKPASSCTEDLIKDNLYNKSCSKESLQSFLSDGTTVDAELTLKKQIDCVGPFSDLSEVRILNNSVLAGNRGHCVEGQQLNRISNSCSSIVGSRLCNNGSYFAVFGTDNNSTARKKVKASLSRQQALSKRRYFSARDILELVRISEKKFKRRTRSLERGLGK